MKRIGLILTASWFLTTTTVQAGELDAEYGIKASTTIPATPSLTRPSQELDAESPTQTCCLKRRFYAYSYGGPCGYAYGYRRGCCILGYGGGFGYGGFASYGGYGGFGGYGGGFGYGGYGGFY